MFDRLWLLGLIPSHESSADTSHSACRSLVESFNFKLAKPCIPPLHGGALWRHPMRLGVHYLGARACAAEVKLTSS